MVYILISDPIVSIIQRAPLKGKIQMQTRISTRKTFFERLHCFRYKQLQIVTATGQQGHNSGPARDTIAGQKLS